MIFRNLSLHRRLMGACFLLTLLPVCLLGGLGWLLLTSIDLFGGTLPGKMVRLWPKGPVLSVQYAVSRLRDEASHEKFDWHEVKEQCDLLEANGIQAYIEENGTPFYLTSGADAAQIQKAAREKMGSQRQAIVWDDDGFACVYTSSRRQAAIYAAGDMPYQQPPYTAEQKAWRREVKALLWLLFGGGMLLSLLVLPLYIPALIFGAGAVEADMAGLGAGGHLSLLGALLALATFFAPWAATAALRAAISYSRCGAGSNAIVLL